MEIKTTLIYDKVYGQEQNALHQLPAKCRSQVAACGYSIHAAPTQGHLFAARASNPDVKDDKVWRHHVCRVVCFTPLGDERLPPSPFLRENVCVSVRVSVCYLKWVSVWGACLSSDAYVKWMCVRVVSLVWGDVYMCGVSTHGKVWRTCQVNASEVMCEITVWSGMSVRVFGKWVWASFPSTHKSLQSELDSLSYPRSELFLSLGLGLTRNANNRFTTWQTVNYNDD